ncbi:MAG TPA: MarR family transcriptional regulator [Gemmatimonadales bacterium]
MKSIRSGDGVSRGRKALLEALNAEGRHHSTATVLFHAALATRLGLNPTDHKCVDLLLRTGPLSAGELAERTGLTTGAITGVVDRLERARWVRRGRDAKDRRRVIIEPLDDPKIARRVSRLFEPLVEAFASLTAGYSDHDLGVILDFMRRSRVMLEGVSKRLRHLP